MTHSATLSNSAPSAAKTSKLALARHYGEMVLVMFVGMAGLGGLTELGAPWRQPSRRGAFLCARGCPRRSATD